MSKFNPTIVGIGYSVPETVITNEDLTKILDTSDEWITTRTGIKERRLVSGDETSADYGVKAAEEALSKANMSPEEIDMIICASSIPTLLYPNAACVIQERIGAKNAAAFDISVACSGLIYGLSIAKAFVEAGMYKNILIVAADANSRLMDWTDRSICVLFGDGAGAMVVKASETEESDILSIEICADGTKGDNIQLTLSGSNCPLVEPNTQEPLFIKMKGKEVYKFVVTTMPDSINNCLNLAGLAPEEVDYLIPHQANLRIIEALQERLGYSDEKVITNLQYYGNTSAASVPIAMCESIKEGKVKLPSKAIVCGFGAGLAWGTAIIKLRKGIY